MDYIDDLEKKIDSQDYEIEMMINQIHLMWEYMRHLENSEKELMCLLSKYHDDDCAVCDRAYKVQDMTQFQRGVFNGASSTAMEAGNWVLPAIKK